MIVGEVPVQAVGPVHLADEASLAEPLQPARELTEIVYRVVLDGVHTLRTRRRVFGSGLARRQAEPSRTSENPDSGGASEKLSA